jgi:hypothetical protein
VFLQRDTHQLATSAAKWDKISPASHGVFPFFWGRPPSVQKGISRKEIEIDFEGGAPLPIWAMNNRSSIGGAAHMVRSSSFSGAADDIARDGKPATE